MTVLGQNGFRGLLTDHVDRAHNEESGNSGKHRCVHDAQTFRSVHAKIAVEHATLLQRSDRARAGRMVTPGVGAHIVLQILI